MSAITAISWTDSTWTPVRAMRLAPQEDGTVKRRIGWHCEHVSPGCVHCYSERLNRFVGTGQEFKPAHLVHVTGQGDMRGDVNVFLDEKMLTQPLRWKRGRTIFVCSMTDLFAEFVSDEIIDRMFAVMALAPQHTYQVLTKRSARMRAYFAHPIREALIGQQVGLLELARSGSPVSEWSGLPMPHVWLGVSAEDQKRADERLPDLLATPAAVRFVSIEPMLGQVAIFSEITGELLHTSGDEFDPGSIDLVIVGGESGRLARPFVLGHAKEIVRQCRAADVPVHVKQLGARPVNREGVPHPISDRAGSILAEWPEELRVQEFPA